MATADGHKYRNDYLRQAKKNARQRPLKKTDWKTRNKYAGLTTKKNCSNRHKRLYIHEVRNLHKYFFDIHVFELEKEYLKRMLSGSYIDPKEKGALSFMSDVCKYCSHRRWRHIEGKCPNVRKVRGAIPKKFKRTLDHFFVKDEKITAMVIETLILEGFDIREEFRLNI